MILMFLVLNSLAIKLWWLSIEYQSDSNPSQLKIETPHPSYKTPSSNY